MMDNDQVREIAAGMSKEKGEHYESLRIEKQIHWYCKAEFALKALEAAGYEVRRKKDERPTSNIERPILNEGQEK